MGPAKSMSACPGKAEQVGLELLKARLSLGRAGTEPPDHPPQLETHPGGMKPLVPGCPVLQPQHKHQTLDPNPSIRESICPHANQTGESPKPNSAESIQPHHLTSNLPQDEQSVSAGGGSANKRQLAQIYQSLSRTVAGFSALKITEGKGSHFITFDRTGSWSRQVSAGEQSRHRTPQTSLTPLRCEAEAKWGQG